MMIVPSKATVGWCGLRHMGGLGNGTSIERLGELGDTISCFMQPVKVLAAQWDKKNVPAAQYWVAAVVAPHGDHGMAVGHLEDEWLMDGSMNLDFVIVPYSRLISLSSREAWVRLQQHMQVENHILDERGQTHHYRNWSAQYLDTLNPYSDQGEINHLKDAD
ncbi:hypothetical protein E2C01_003621 [Portunus trituberculatus]|uniref:Uncharacterized protein n=1 Tax=Portunus trituberculatus TaxID=210409 RepID=A0A5B7CQM4_PORTR|nr:hypothetical protein [Portunus trituberculatus]